MEINVTVRANNAALEIPYRAGRFAPLQAPRAHLHGPAAHQAFGAWPPSSAAPAAGLAPCQPCGQPGQLAVTTTNNIAQINEQHRES